MKKITMVLDEWAIVRLASVHQLKVYQTDSTET